MRFDYGSKGKRTPKELTEPTTSLGSPSSKKGHGRNCMRKRSRAVIRTRRSAFFSYFVWISGLTISELKDPPGSRLPVHLHSSTRAPTLQHVADRMNLICAQNGLAAP